MIVKITRGTSVGGLVRYLFGPGRANEHYAQHVVAGGGVDRTPVGGQLNAAQCASSPGSSTASAPSPTSQPARGEDAHRGAGSRRDRLPGCTRDDRSAEGRADRLALLPHQPGQRPGALR